MKVGKYIILIWIYLASNIANIIFADNLPVPFGTPFGKFSNYASASSSYNSPYSYYDQQQQQQNQQYHRYPTYNSQNNRYYQSPPASSNSLTGLAPESVCSTDSSCAGYPLAFCDGICKCREGALNAGSTCISLSNSNAISRGSCPSGQTYVSEIGACMALRSQPTESCSLGEQCSGGSTCVDGVCLCPPGTNSINGRCVTPVTGSGGHIPTGSGSGSHIPIGPGSNCVRVGVKCAYGSECVAGYCTCPMDFKAIKGRCVSQKGAYPGETCSNGEECQRSSYCNTETLRCECIDKTTMPIGRTCVPRLRSHPGYPCGNGELCSGNSVCDKGTCVCPRDYLLRDRTCIEPPSAKLGDPCGTGQICTDNSECDLSTKRCICKPTYQSVQGVCRQLSYARVGDFCVGPEIRCSGGSYCVSGKCVCIQGLQNVNGICKKMEKVLPGNSCTDAQECIGFSVCQERVCQCMAPRMLRGNRCEVPTKVAIGKSCRISDICLGGSSCIHNVCQCGNDEIVSRGGCIKRPRVKPGDICHANDICSSNSMCFKGICTCYNGYMVKNDVCIQSKRVSPGMSCKEEEECDGGSICLDEICTCPLNKPSIVDGTCVPESANQIGNNIVYPMPTNPSLPLQYSTTAPSIHSTTRNVPEYSQPNPVQSITYPSRPSSSHSSSYSSSHTSTYPSGHPQSHTSTPPSAHSSTNLPPYSLPNSSFELVKPCPTDGKCSLPYCFCSPNGLGIPGNLRPSETPQMVIITYEGPITDRIINIFKSLFSGKFKNPNSCPIKGTFFISHEWNNYDQVQWLFSSGHEIGVNSITREARPDRSIPEWKAEMVGMREALERFSYVDASKVTGVRAPRLAMGGDNQLKMMASNKFVYDNSLFVEGGPFWPQTLDYKTPWTCPPGQHCPQEKYPALWQFPINEIIRADGKRVSMLRSALKVYETPFSLSRMILNNFNRSVSANKAPFVLNLDADYLNSLPQGGAVNALEMFLETILSRGDTYVVTMSQAIEWMQRPITLANIKNFTPWQCRYRIHQPIRPCENPSICSYSRIQNSAGLPHSFRVCGSCPRAYPWLNDPTGTNQGPELPYGQRT